MEATFVPDEHNRSQSPPSKGTVERPAARPGQKTGSGCDAGGGAAGVSPPANDLYRL